MTASVLSPLAKPFHPSMGEEAHPTIFNNGVPILTVKSTETDFLRTISDEALDEAFPPSAEEAAELEAVEMFVMLMMNLDSLEEREEAARTIYAGLAKRWEARRTLQGKPREAKGSIKEVKHGDPRSQETRHVVIHNSGPSLADNHMRMKENAKKNKTQMNFKATKPMHSRPIQQPRKHS
eukprot:Nitzschia sp. Nitz4//scaffold2_size372955//152622//153161//NITZ4_000408-RA/size372955-processed-gene-0.497-mRNA-1//-1//CDS//3329546733//2297//frame0